ncbi:MAG: alpha/beta fold hydrolase [Chloroflexi bacterium]|nr:alpha/beta fold hydrolase [Chloroflexota bacterium]
MITRKGEPFFFPGNGVGCLLVHGFVSTPQEMRWLGSQLSASGYTVLGIRLFGHASHPSDLNRVRWEDWLASLEDGVHLLRHRCDRIVVIGHSLGGVIAFIGAGYLNFDGLITTSTPFHTLPYRRIRRLEGLLPLLRPLSIFIRTVPKPPPLDYVDPQAAKQHLTYSVFPLRALPEIAEMFEEMRQVLPQLSLPTLLIHSLKDRGVPISNVDELSEHFGGSELEILKVENSGHVIVLEPERERVLAAMVAFISKINTNKARQVQI